MVGAIPPGRLDFPIDPSQTPGRAAGTELVTQNLAIEPDLQSFLSLVYAATLRVGGHPFRSARTLAGLPGYLRAAGAAAGQPFAVTLAIEPDTRRIVARAGSLALPIVTLAALPSETDIASLREELRRSTENADPALLLARNAEMERSLAAARTQAESEFARFESELAARVSELKASLHAAHTDGLTGLANRRAYDLVLAQAVQRATREHSTLALALCDIDHFKAINDAHGHPYGDRYLCRMADALGSVTRGAEDFAFRFGGDEFAFLTGESQDHALEMATKLLTLMDARLSIGLATLDDSDRDPKTLIARADAALYEAKHRGRGRILIAPSPGAGATGFLEVASAAPTALRHDP